MFEITTEHHNHVGDAEVVTTTKFFKAGEYKPFDILVVEEGFCRLFNPEADEADKAAYLNVSQFTAQEGDENHVYLHAKINTKAVSNFGDKEQQIILHFEGRGIYLEEFK